MCKSILFLLVVALYEFRMYRLFIYLFLSSSVRRVLVRGADHLSAKTISSACWETAFLTVTVCKRTRD